MNQQPNKFTFLGKYKPSIFLLLLTCSLCILPFTSNGQDTKQKGLLWEITGNGLKKPSYVYGTMHVSSKLAFHLGDSFYKAMMSCETVAFEQNFDSVIHLWITEKPSSKKADNEVLRRRTNGYFGLNYFKLNTFNKELVQYRMSSETQVANYILKRGDDDNFEEDAWLDLYIYQMAKRTGKKIAGVEGYDESRKLVDEAYNDDDDEKEDKNKKKINYSTRSRLSAKISPSYRKGEIWMLDSINRTISSEHYLEYMLYKRNENQVRRMDSIMKLGNTLFTAVGCAHLPGKRGVLMLLESMGYKVKPINSIANEKSKLAEKYEKLSFKHTYNTVQSNDGFISAKLPSRLSKVKETSEFETYFCPDLANGHFYQIDKINTYTAFTGKPVSEILLQIDSILYESIPGKIENKKNISNNGMDGYEITSRLKTGDIQRFRIIASPFHLYIIRIAGKKDFALSKAGDNFFNSIKINEYSATDLKKIAAPDSFFTVEIPTSISDGKFPAYSKTSGYLEHLAFNPAENNIYMVQQVDLINYKLMEDDTFTLHIMANSFASTDNYDIEAYKIYKWNGYSTMDATFTNKKKEHYEGRFVAAGRRHIMFVQKSKSNEKFESRFFKTMLINGAYIDDKSFEYKDTSLFYTVKTTVKPYLVVESDRSSTRKKPKKIDLSESIFTEHYFAPHNANEFIEVNFYQFGRYDNIDSLSDYSIRSKKAPEGSILAYKKAYYKNGTEFLMLKFSDTGTTKQVWRLRARKGEVSYHVYAVVDTLKPVSKFYTEFFQSFTPSLDTIIGTNVYEAKGYRIISDIKTGDSLTRVSAFDNVSESEYTLADAKQLIALIDSLNVPVKDYQSKKANLYYALFSIKNLDAATLQFALNSYNKAKDTATYIQVLLNGLSENATQPSYETIRKILASDPPVVKFNEYGNCRMFSNMADTAILTKPLLPLFIDLLEIDEYRQPVYKLLSAMLDSSIITAKELTPYLPKLMTQAKINLKRQKGNDYNYSNSNLYYLTNIMGYAKNIKPEIQSFLLEIAAFTNKAERKIYLPLMFKHNITVEDSVIQSMSKNKETRYFTYYNLNKYKLLNKFPEQYKTQKEIASAMIYPTASSYNKIDSIINYGSRIITINNESKKVYLFKTHSEDDASNEWEAYASSPFSMDSTILSPLTNVQYMRKSMEEALSEEKMFKELMFLYEYNYRKLFNGLNLSSRSYD